MLYLCLFIVVIICCTLLARLYDKVAAIDKQTNLMGRKRKKGINVNVLILTILIGFMPLLLAGLRSYSVGVDTCGIYYPYYYVPYCLNGQTYEGTEIGFYLILKIGYWLFNSYTGCLFLISAITIYFSLAGIMYFKDRTNVYMIVFLWLCFYFGVSLNIMRQSCAVALVFFALRYLDKGKYVRYIIWVAIATLIHNSAIIALVLILFKICQKHKRLFKWVAIFIIGLVIILPTIMEIISQIPIFSIYSSRYIGEFDFSFSNYAVVIYNLPIYIIVLINFRKLIKLDKRNVLFVLMTLMSAVCSLFKLYMVWISRLADYFTFGGYILVAQYANSIAYKKDRFIIKFALIIYGIAYFVLNFYVLENGEIFPYAFI